MERWLNGVWYEGRAGASLLLPLAVLFGVIVRVRRALYRLGPLRQRRAPVPVIVVGNISVGGTGKTPFTIWLARSLAARGHRVGVLCRGYGGTLRTPALVGRGADPAVFGDEAVLLAEAFAPADAGASPVIVAAARNRVAGALQLAQCGATLIICDDGLQHYALARDFEIAVVDARRGLGNRSLLPAGPLREPPGRLSEVDVVVVNRAAAAGDLAVAGRADWDFAQAGTSTALIEMVLTSGPAAMLAPPGGRRALGEFRGRPVHAVAGIGDPARFFAALQAEGLQCECHAFADHHPFRPEDLQFPGADPILMTVKDAVKCREFATDRMWEVMLEATIDAPAASALLHRLDQLGRRGSNPDASGTA